MRTATGWELRSPVAVPPQRWADLVAAQRGAEAIALMSLPDPFAVKHERENAKSHPMGSPLNRTSLPAPHNFKISESKVAGDPGVDSRIPSQGRMKARPLTRVWVLWVGKRYQT